MKMSVLPDTHEPQSHLCTKITIEKKDGDPYVLTACMNENSLNRIISVCWTA